MGHALFSAFQLGCLLKLASQGWIMRSSSSAVMLFSFGLLFRLLSLSSKEEGGTRA
jgi:hypothetical protein